MISIKKEITIFIVLFILSSLIIHYSSWFINPLEHINSLRTHPLSIHPLLYVFFIYILLAVFRVIVVFVKKIFKR